MGHSAGRGTLIYEKNLKLKISIQTPLKLLAYDLAILHFSQVCRYQSASEFHELVR